MRKKPSAIAKRINEHLAANFAHLTAHQPVQLEGTAGDGQTTSQENIRFDSLSILCIRLSPSHPALLIFEPVEPRRRAGRSESAVGPSYDSSTTRRP